MRVVNLVDATPAISPSSYDPWENNSAHGQEGRIELWLQADGSFQLLSKIDNNYLVFAAEGDVGDLRRSDALLPAAESTLQDGRHLSNEVRVWGDDWRLLHDGARRAEINPMPGTQRRKITLLPARRLVGRPEAEDAQPYAYDELAEGFPADGFGSAVADFYSLERSRCDRDAADPAVRADLARLEAELAPGTDSSPDAALDDYVRCVPAMLRVENTYPHLSLAEDDELRTTYLRCRSRCSDLYNSYMSAIH